MIYPVDVTFRSRVVANEGAANAVMRFVYAPHIAWPVRKCELAMKFAMISDVHILDATRFDLEMACERNMLGRKWLRRRKLEGHTCKCAACQEQERRHFEAGLLFQSKELYPAISIYSLETHVEELL